MATAKKPQVTKEAIENANNLWSSFMKWTTWGVLAIIGCLALMALFLL